MPADLPRLMELYSAARTFMRYRGNLSQWTGGYPSISVVREGVSRGEQWVVCRDGLVVATFWFAVAPEPAYERIFDGEWLSSSGTYGVVHRLASDGAVSGVGAFVLRWALARCGDVRVDTHRDNSVMQSLLRREEFTHCGTIFLADGSSRDAFERILSIPEAKKMLREQVNQLGRAGVSGKSEKPGSTPRALFLGMFCGRMERGSSYLNDTPIKARTGTRTVALYNALPDEPSLDELLDKWLGTKRLALPVVVSTPGSAPEMEFREYTGPECLREGRFGIREPFGTPLVPPHRIDLMFVPGVAYTADGQRLGRGGGFYDRYLSSPDAANIYKIGVCPPQGLVEWLPTEEHDVTVDKIWVVE